jgi:protein-L-isoaspartate(D-aspartate) O-methyltransferase
VVIGRVPGSGNDWQEARAARERERMVEEQLGRRGITDGRVLDAMRKVPRQHFVEEALRDRAYGDHPLPIGDGQTISQPYMVAAMTQLLRLTGSEKVLEVGSGSGYQTAVLAELARRVCSIERLPGLAARARRILEELGYTNAVIRTGDGTYGWPDEAPFDRILVTAGAPAVPGPLVQQLAEGGRLVVPVGEPQSQTLHVVEKVGGQTRTSTDCGCVFVKLVGRYGWEE